MGLVARPYQIEAEDAVFRELAKVKKTLIVLPTGCGKCLGRGTPVLMFDGTVKPVESVVVGDELMGPDSRPRRVLSLARGREMMYRVHPVKGDPYIVNESHILSLKLTPDAPGKGQELVNLSVRDYLKMSATFKHRAKGWRTGVEFAFRETTIDPYFLGLWLGDGTATKPDISKPDAEVAEAFAREARRFGMVPKLVKSSAGACPTYTMTRPGCMAEGRDGVRPFKNPMAYHLRALGLSPEKFVPHLYKANSRRVRLQVLAGLMDSDGSVTAGGYEFVSKERKLAEDVVYLSRSLGLAAYLSPCRKGCQGGFVGDYFRVSISGDCTVIPTRIARKKAPPRFQKKDVLVTGIKVEAVGFDDYFGFEIDGDRLFVLGDFTVTHNTVVFGLVARRWLESAITPDRVLILAHREELIVQARDELAGIIGTVPEVEMAGFYARSGSDLVDDRKSIVVASVQSLCQPARLSRFRPDEFALVVIDEAHHATAASYRRIVDHFAAAKVLGVTATPQRADKAILGSVFDSVCYEMGIVDAVGAGWLVPVHQQFVTVSDLDLAAVGTVAGELNQGQLGSILTGDSVLDRMVAATVELCGSEPTLIFTTARSPGDTVAQGDVFADALNRIKPGSAVYLTGETPDDDRRVQLRRYEEGEFQYLVGCALFTEGFNSPRISRVVMARPTKSIVYYTQSIGRGTRTLRGVLSADLDTPEARKAAIAASAKPNLLVIDFVGNSGKHKLISAADIFAAGASEKAVQRAKDKAEKAGGAVDMAKAVADEEDRIRREEMARERIEADRRRNRERVRVNRVDMDRRDVDPFGYGDGTGRQSGVGGTGPATAGQRQWIDSHGGILETNATSGEAGIVIAEMKRRFQCGYCSMKQERQLRKRGLCEDGPMPKEHAKALIDWLSSSGWPDSIPRLERANLGIVKGDGGYRLKIFGVPVGRPFSTPESVRSIYKGMVPETPVGVG